MSNLYDDMRRLIDEREARELDAQRTASNDERFGEINSKLDSLTEAVTGLVSSAPPLNPPGGSGNGGDPPTPPDDGGSPPPVPPDPPAPELPVEVVTPLTVPRIYNGDDEPAEVRYIDPGSGEEKTRVGRRKGHVSIYSVEPYEPEPPQE